MKYAWVAVATVVMVFSFALAAQADISTGFDNFETGVRPTGWSFYYCGLNSDADMVNFGAAAPSLTLSAYGEIVLSPVSSSGATSVQFWALASNPSSTLLVREWDGATWTRVTMISDLATSGTTYGPLALNGSSSQQVEFTFKAGVNINLDDIVIAGATGPAAPTATPTPALVIGPTPVHLVVDWDDFNGNGSTDLAVYDPATGDWNIRNIATDVNFGGGANDIPCPGDYDGDGVADLAYFDASAGTWYASQVDLTPIINGTTWGALGDIPAPGDYDGDGTANLATFRPSDGVWRVQSVTAVSYSPFAGGIPVPGDYDGDGTIDTALVVPDGSLFAWYVNGTFVQRWGYTSDIPMPMDYDGNGVTDIATYRPSNRTWYISGIVNKYWGAAGDMPAVADVDGNGRAELIQFRPSRNLWWYFGTSGQGNVSDFPAAGTDTIVTGASAY